MAGFCVHVEYENDDDPQSRGVEIVGPFRSYEAADKVAQRIIRRTEKAHEKASDESCALVGRSVMVYRLRGASDVIKDTNTWLLETTDEEDGEY